MCIRDRREVEELKVKLAAAGVGAAAGASARGGSSREFLDPVSYTHLRAHETVLDLVCRLLLEKKKTQYHNQPQ